MAIFMMSSAFPQPTRVAKKKKKKKYPPPPPRKLTWSAGVYYWPPGHPTGNLSTALDRKAGSQGLEAGSWKVHVLVDWRTWPMRVWWGGGGGGESVSPGSNWGSSGFALAPPPPPPPLSQNRADVAVTVPELGVAGFIAISVTAFST